MTNANRGRRNAGKSARSTQSANSPKSSPGKTPKRDLEVEELFDRIRTLPHDSKAFALLFIDAAFRQVNGEPPQSGDDVYTNSRLDIVDKVIVILLRRIPAKGYSAVALVKLLPGFVSAEEKAAIASRLAKLAKCGWIRKERGLWSAIGKGVSRNAKAKGGAR